MKVKDIIKLVCTYLQLTDLSQTVALGGTVPNSAETTSEINLLLDCVNLTNNLIASEYVKLYKTTTIHTDNGKIYLSDIGAEKLHGVHSVKNRYGKTLVFKMFDDYIKTASGEVCVTYTYYPDKVGINDFVLNYKTKISERVFAYGVASEYSFIKSIYDDATIWENRFKNSLLQTSKKSGLYIKPQRWF